mmetsp:Transcript_32295/g.51569  ORF Transcript_32295/g.51569 Transcript_32295/m.51569 type:complete len:494 (-) Transcript_32295:2138-3619(-)
MSAEDLGAFLDYEEEEDEAVDAAEAGGGGEAPREERSGGVCDLDAPSEVKEAKEARDENAPRVQEAAGEAAKKRRASVSSVGSSGGGKNKVARRNSGGFTKFKVTQEEKKPVPQAVEVTSSGGLALPNLAALSDALAKAKNAKEQRKKPAPAVSGSCETSVKDGEISKAAVKVSSSIMLSHLPEHLCVAEKLKSHFLRYGPVRSVVCEKDRGYAFLCFEDKSGATRAFVNRAPVLKNFSIHVYRIPDHSAATRKQAESFAVRAPNRKVVEHNPGQLKSKKNESVTENAEEEKKPVASSVSSLYANINMSGVKKTAETGTGKTGGKPQFEKQTWSRAGLPNMNDKEVLKARINEKRAAKQVVAAKEQVAELMKELGKQKEDFKMLGTDAKTIGKNLRAQLMGNIKLLMAQLHHAQGSMSKARAAVAKAKSALEVAIENSKTPKKEVAEDSSTASPAKVAEETPKPLQTKPTDVTLESLPKDEAKAKQAVQQQNH